MRVKILSSNEKIYEGESEKITLPGKEGQFQILENHAPIFALLDKGEIVVGETKVVPIFSGLVEVLKNKVIVLVKQL